MQQPATPAPDSGYYPPAPSSGPASPVQTPLAPRSMAPANNLWVPTLASSYTPTTLSSGQQLKFFGSRVYAVDAKGIPHPLPDGRYTLYNGSVNLIVKDGEKIILD
jgi:hypothetical protein